MRDYGKVLTRLWHNRRFQALTDDGRLTYLYLLTNEHGNMLGLYRLPFGYAASDMNWDVERFRKGFETVSKGGLAVYEEATETVYVNRFLAHDPMANPNVVRGAVKELRQLANGSPLLPQLLADIRNLDEVPDYYQPLIKCLETLTQTVSEPFRNPEPYPEPEPIPEPEQEGGASPPRAGRSDYPPEFEAAWAAYPRRSGDNPKRKAFECWSARRKEGTDPAELLAAVGRYADWCEGTGKVDTETVMQAKRFFGPDKPFLNSWELPKEVANGKPKSGAAVLAEGCADAWAS